MLRITVIFTYICLLPAHLRQLQGISKNSSDKASKQLSDYRFSKSFGRYSVQRLYMNVALPSTWSSCLKDLKDYFVVFQVNYVIICQLQPLVVQKRLAKLLFADNFFFALASKFNYQCHVDFVTFSSTAWNILLHARILSLIKQILTSKTWCVHTVSNGS